MTEDTLRLVGRASEPLAVGDVQLDRVHGLTGERLHGQVDVVPAEIGDHDVHARADERRRHAEPDPAGAAGDECRLALDLLHQSPGQEASARIFPARRPSSTASRSAGTGSSGNAAIVSSKISRSSSRWSGCVKT